MTCPCASSAVLWAELLVNKLFRGFLGIIILMGKCFFHFGTSKHLHYKPYNNPLNTVFFQFWLVMRHKFVPLPQPLSNGAVACCESCGALNNAGVLGCIADEAPAPGNYPFLWIPLSYFHRIFYISVFYLLLMNVIWWYNFMDVILFIQVSVMTS